MWTLSTSVVPSGWFAGVFLFSVTVSWPFPSRFFGQSLSCATGEHCYHKTTKISPKTGPKTQKSASGARPPAEPQKKMLQTKKIEVKKLKNTGFFHFSLADFGRARSRTGVFRTVFYSVF